LLEGKPHDAEAAMRSAVELEPRNALYHYWLGKTLEANNSLYEAISYYEKAVTLNSRLGVALRALGQSALERNQFDKARDWFDKYREAQPDDHSIWNDIGESYSRQNREDDAMRAFQTAVKHTTKNARARLAIGNILANKGQDREATREFELATRADPKLGDAWCQLGLSLARTKITKEARKALERCVAIPSTTEDLRVSAKEALETKAN
jgi:tetratricopeptide (TPR) repeat protein